MDWQLVPKEIDTTVPPFDGTYILTWAPGWCSPADNYYCGNAWYEYGEPTHWMPMPLPPIPNDNVMFMPNDRICLAQPTPPQDS